MDVQMDPVHARRVIPPRPEEDTGGPNTFCQAIGGLAGGLVLIASVVLSASCIVTITFAEQKAHQAFQKDQNYNTGQFMGHQMGWSYLWLAYYSLVALLMSLVIENIYFYIITGTEVLSPQQEGPLIRWTWYFKVILPCYLVFFLAVVINLIIGIISLHRTVLLLIPFRIAVYLDIVIVLLNIYVHWVAVQINWSISVRERINALAQLRVEVDDLDDTLDDCVICRETPVIGDVIRELPCRHTFHKTCVDKWLIVRPTCPICKRRV